MRLRLAALISAFGLLLAVSATALAAPGDIVPLAGTGADGYAGDGGPAVAALLQLPSDAVADGRGGYLIADKKNFVVRRITSDGVIHRVAGVPGTPGYNGDGIAAITAQLSYVSGVAPLPDGGFLLADAFNRRIRKVSAQGVISTVAGNGTQGYSGDGGPATAAQLDFPVRVDPIPGGGYLITDFGSSTIRRVSAGGTISTVAGTGVAGYNGDGIQATTAQLNQPSSATPTHDGGVLISEYLGARVRKVSPGGVIQTIAGTGTSGFNGDNIPPATAMLNQPTTAYETVYGSILIADYNNERVRLIRSPGTAQARIVTVAGTGAPGDTGDNGPATAATFEQPAAATPHPDGGFVITLLGNSRVRRVLGESPPAVCGAGSWSVIAGGPFADTLSGLALRDAIVGRGRADNLTGRAGADCLLGGAAADELTGGAGNDNLRGGPGADDFSGGPGRDSLRGGPGGDTVSSGAGNDVLRGGPGRDHFLCGAGRDVVHAGRGDTVARDCEVVR